MIRTTNVRNGFIDTDNVRYVTEETYKRWTRRLVPKRGDVILTREAPLGGAGKVRSDDHIFLGQRLYHFRPDPNKLDADFLLYALMAPDLQGQIRALGSGATVEHMRLGDIPSLEIEAPALSVQRQIGSILSAYDELIENNQRRIKILEEVVRSLYREWFILFRFPGHDKVKMVSSPLGPIPQGWEVKKLADLTAFLSRGISPKYDEDGDSIVINQKCIRDQRLSLEPARRQTKSIPADKRVRCGDVLINSTGVGTLGRVAQVYEDMEQCTVDSHVTLVRPNSDTDVDFFGCTLLLKQETFERSGIGATGQTELSRMAVGEVKIPVPPDLLQRRFGALAHPMRTATSTLSKQTENLRRTRDLLLPRLLSG
jgi:type I restriction enzyme S subunit